MNKRLTEEEIEKQMDKALDKIPMEIKKIKLVLFIIKRFNRLKTIFKFK
ncbi:MAG: hypothetical protein Q4P79_00760 [Fusobacterium sp.]|nr:hypothetical protein [Fusobacterium sp.]MDO5787963.1 hypothetical protein [Fusobacterium sp.]